MTDHQSTAPYTEMGSEFNPATTSHPAVKNDTYSETASYLSHSTNVAATLGTFGSFQNLVRPYVGGGLLALPAAFRRGGLVSSSILMVLMALAANWCVRSLLTCTSVITAPGWKPFKRQRITTNQQQQQQPTYQQAEDQNSLLYHPSPPLPSAQGPNAAATCVVNAPLIGDRQVNSDDIHLSTLNHQHTFTALNEPVSPLPFTVSAQPSMSEVAALAFPSWGAFANDLCLLLSQFGFCLAYLCFVGDNLAMVTSSLTRNEIIIMFSLCLCLLVQIRNVSRLSITSTLGNIVYMFAIAIIFWDGFKNPLFPPAAAELSYVNWSGLPFVFSTACFSLEGIGLMLPVKNSMREPHKFIRVMDSALAFVTVVYLTFANLGYLFYGDKTNSVITKNLSGGLVSDAVRLSLSIILFFTYVIQMFPVVLFTDALIKDKFFDKKTKKAAMTIQQTMDREQAYKSHDRMLVFAQSAVRCACVIVTCILAILLPKFGVVVDLVGSLCNSGIAFILPALFYVNLVLWPQFCIRTQYPHSTELKLEHITPFIIPAVVIVVGVAASCIGVYGAILEMVHGDE